MSEIIRSLGFYQPFGSLMLHGKIETRWVRVNKKPPFPFGKYLFYSTLKACTESQLLDWSGGELTRLIHETLSGENTRVLNGYALAVGDLVGISTLNDTLRHSAFVESKGSKLVKDKKVAEHIYVQRTLHFDNVKRITPFQFKGKQGVGILTEEQISKIQYEN